MPKGKKNKSAKKQNKKIGPPPNADAPPSQKSAAASAAAGGSGNKKRGRKKKQHASHYYNSAEDLILRESIESDGSRTVVEMDPDGNCLFRSISDQLYHDHGQAHADVRHEICDYLEGHESFFSLFLDLDDDETKGEDASDFADYVETMRQDGEWGGNLELVAAARLYRRCIRVFSSNLAAMNIDYDSDKPPAGPELLVSYHDNDHYNSVRDNSRCGKPPPPPIRTYEKQDYGPPPPAETDEYPSDEGTSIKTEDNDSSRTQSTSKTQGTLNTQSTSSSYGGGGESLSSEKSEDTIEQTPSSTEITSHETENRKSKKPPKANANCPCGSKLKYRKCCKEKDRREAHRQRVLEQNGQAEKSDEEDTIMEGKFRVLSI